MHVNKIASSVAAEALQRAQQMTSPQGPVDPVTPTRGADAVQLSDAGLALASEGTSNAPAAPLDSQRADQIRSNILSGAYNSLDMADQVARAVIRSGDL
jgi:anti-sigma28 factor (negative regulator of flagellin synthesis)